MDHEDVELPEVERLERLEAGDKSRRSRIALAVVLLLLLLMCVVTTVVDTWVTAPTAEQRTAILRNVECLRCHVELIPDFTRDTVHNPFMNKRCTTCHTPHGEIVRTVSTYGPVQRWQRLRTLIEWLPFRIVCEMGQTSASLVGRVSGAGGKTRDAQRKGAESKLVLPKDQLCWLCHGDVGPQKSMKFTHNPFDQGRCTACHNPHASDHRALMTQDETDLCVTCHPVGAELSRSQVHPTFGSRHCLTCHDPHASDYRGIIVASQRELCFTCHPSVAPMSLLSVQHDPFKDDCTACHEPHGSDHTPLLRKEQPPLCYDCHPLIASDFLRPSHHPADTLRLRCADCHDPHAASNGALLVEKDNTLCYLCHTFANGDSYAIRWSYEPSLHGKKKILCVRCHTPHGSAYAPLLRRSNPDLCVECHGAFVDGANKHPYRPTSWDVAAKTPMTCSTTCHDPHGTDQNHMLKRYSYPDDGQCLQCHGLTPGRRVGVDF